MKKNEKVKKQKSVIFLTLAILLVLCGVAAGIVVHQFKNAESTVKMNKANVEWYSETGETFTITTVDELYDLAALSDFYDFKGQTIILGADIVVNEGNAADWEKEPPEKTWFPIQGFAGTFDGQGHTISGLYGMGSSTPMGLFSDTHSKCEIRDFKLLNSYFFVNGSKGVGSISANGSGSFEKIYSDAIVAGSNHYVGGLIGRIDSGRENSVIARASKIVDCWFDGEVRLTSSKSRMGGGFVGAIAVGAVKIEHCLSSGEIHCADEKEAYHVGGFCGAVGDIGKSTANATLHINDSLHVGEINTPHNNTAGNFVGNLATAAAITVKDSYTKKNELNIFDVTSGALNGTALAMKETLLIGQEAYRWTELDFSKYWSAIQDKTPELTYFTEETSMNLEGVAKAYNTDWYDENLSEFVLDTVEDLYGFQMLCNQKNTFAGKTVKLGADIIVNEGKATDWAKGENLPILEWIPIGGGGNKYMPFAGTFDGQGHTISGLYTKSDDLYLGLFGVLAADGSSTVKNLKLINSYFECTRTENQAGEVDGLGSIAGQGAGTLDTIYSDAILVSGTRNTGGLIGNQRQDKAPLTVKNCWFNGSATGTFWVGGILGFVHGSVAYTNMEDCLVTAELSSTLKEGNGFVGGLSGRITSGTVTSCLVAGKLTGPEAVRGFIGLVASQASQTVEITKCYNATNAKVMFTGGLGKTMSLMLKNISEEELKGTKGYVNTLLNFYGVDKKNDGRWVAVMNKIPQLKSFTSGNMVNVKGLARAAMEVDISWYNASKKTYTIKNKEQLYGLAELCNSGIDFSGKTIHLGADIVVNEGKAIEWANGVNLPIYTWTPIGGGVNSLDYKPFAGTFDGQGHTISGLYMKSDGYYLGLFGVLVADGSSTIKNLKLTNSYFECTRTDQQVGEIDGLGSIAGQGAGTLDTIYSDAIIMNGTRNTGGLVGNVRHENATLNVKNCWFDGSVKGTFWIGGIIGFVHGSTQSTNVTNCMVTADLTSTLETGNALMGGISGRALVGKFTSCVVVGEVNGPGSCVCGFIGNAVTKTTQTLKMSRCYNATNVAKHYTSNPSAGYKQPTTSQVKYMSVDKLVDTQGYLNTLLDFYAKGTNETGMWALRKNELLALRSFVGADLISDLGAMSSIIRPIEEDISWYDEKKKEFTISTIGELYGLAQLCNDGNTFAGKTIKLAADIKANNGKAADWAKGKNVPANMWIPIGGGPNSKLYRPFAGTFDGQGHTISGLYMKSDGYYLGLFGVLDANGSSTIKNFKLTNSYFESTKTTQLGGEIDGLGSIAGRGSGTLDTIYSDVILVSKTQNTGGFVGTHRTGNLDVVNCWFDGTVTGTQWIGGIAGFVHGEVTHTNLTDCLVTADLTSTMTTGDAYVGGLLGRVNGGEITSCVAIGDLTGSKARGIIGLSVTLAGKTLAVSKCYNTTNATVACGIGHGTPTISEVKTLSEDDLKGTKGYENTLLAFYDKNTNKSGRWALVQNELPELKSIAKSEYMKDLSSLSDLARPVVVDTSWYNASNNEYVISTLGELYGLAKLCNEGNTFGGKTVKLGADIKGNNGKATDWAKGEKIPNNIWTPIGGGTTSKDYRPFSGTFDGQGYTISGLYMKSDGYYLGLFGVLDANGSSTIKNLKLTNSYFESTKTTQLAGEIDGLGGIAGRGSGTLDTIYSDVILVSKTQNTGGFVGTHRTGNLDVENCWFNGTVTGTQWIGGIAGFVHGEVTHTNLTDCLVTADLTSTMTTGDAYVGGLLGRANGGNITSCVAVGKLTGSKARGIIGLSVTLAGKTLVVSKCYNVTNTTVAYGIGYGTPTISEVKTMREDNLKGTAAYSNTLLDFYVKDKNEDGKWVAIKNGLPELKSFAQTDKVESVGNLSRNVVTDTSWYDASKTEYTICTAGELYGLAQLCNNGNTFAGKTIKLGADIKVNYGLATEWAKGNVIPNNLWIPIGGGTTSNDYKPFEGIFDGQGHTISGLYMKSNGYYLGLFGVLHANAKSIVKNLKLINSYFESTKTTELSNELEGIGSIAGRGNGTLDSVYSDAIVVSATKIAGGLVGNHRTTTLDIVNCWFDGTVTGTQWIGGIVGFVHGEATRTNLTDCLVTADLTSTMKTGNVLMGGLSGRAIAGEFNSCVVVGKLTGPSGLCGFVGNSVTQTSQTFKLTNCYNVTNVQTPYTYNTSTGYKAPTVSHVLYMSENDLKGETGYTNTLLNYYDKNTNTTGRWVLIENKLPELKSFTKKKYVDDLGGLSRP